MSSGVIIPLKSVKLGFMFKGDIPCESKEIEGATVSTDITQKASEKGGKPRR